MMRRPVLRYFGGKFLLKEWIISHFPAHRVYTEVFGGAASVLLSKPRSKVEVYNDLDQQLFNLFRVLRDRGHELRAKLELTPYSRDEYLLSRQFSEDELEQARRTVVRHWLSMSTDETKNPSGSIGGFRSYSGRNLASEWRGYIDSIPVIVERLNLIYIENDDAAAVLQRNDYEDSLHYVDPPYVPETRSSGGYSHDMTTGQHVELAKVLGSLKGMVILSGYNCPLYDELFTGWQRIDRTARADSRAERIESLWLNPAAQDKQPQRDLFMAA